MGKVSSKSWQYLRLLIFVFLGLAIAMTLNFPQRAIAQNSANATNVVFQLPSSINKSAELATVQSIIRPTNGNELRGIWLTNVDSDVLFSTENLERAIKRLKRLKFNTIYPTVWNGGYTLYPSKVAEKTYGIGVEPIPELKNRDMLAETIKFGHEQNLAVIPWFEYGLMTEEGSAITKKHPDWITKRQDGSDVFLHGEYDQHRLVWLNPARPEVQKFLVDLIVEAVKKYDVDGIQLDDHFGMPVELGYDEYTIALYQKQHSGRTPPADINDPSWVKWRARNVTNLMAKIYREVKAIKPDCLVSLSPNPKDFSYSKYLQDWHTWIYSGFIDELIIQVYRDDINNFKRELEQPELQEIRRKIPVAVGILAGLRVQNIDMRQIKGQVKVARELSLDGFSFFFYETLGNRDASFESLLFAPAVRPDLKNIASR
ncbi:MAG: hypothetical protein AUK48_10175 [Oscillatoriales cyanobacterium CG2_30_44_21]|nr:MAG: hypothetical protein AUK48_10175 [Oscillatoriales cyanobacterium CG2_30_44_21]